MSSEEEQQVCPFQNFRGSNFFSCRWKWSAQFWCSGFGAGAHYAKASTTYER